MKLRLPSSFLFLFFGFAALAASGCHYRSITTPQGARYRSFNLGAAADVRELDAFLNPETGAFRVRIGAAATDATAVAGEVLPAGVRALVPSALPR